MASINEFLPFRKFERDSISSSVYTTDTFLGGDITSLIHEFETEIDSEHSFFSAVPYIISDAIFDATRVYNADTSPQKVNLGQGTYRDENGDPWILPSVRMAKEKIRTCGHEYLPIAGLKEFRDGAVDLIFHDLEIGKDRVCRIAHQTLYGKWLTEMVDSVMSIHLGDGFSPPGWSRVQAHKSGSAFGLHHLSDMVEPPPFVRNYGVQCQRCTLLQKGLLRFFCFHFNARRSGRGFDCYSSHLRPQPDRLRSESRSMDGNC